MKPSKQNGDIQEHVLMRIAVGDGCTFAQIRAAVGEDERLVDRALQSLRRRGLVTFTRAGGWVVAERKGVAV